MDSFEEIEKDFFQEQWPRLLGRLRKQFGHQVELEDLENILSTAYMRFRAAAIEGRIEKQWANYWYRAAYNGSIDWLREKAVEREAMADIAQNPEENFVNFPPNSSHTDKSLVQQLLEALKPDGLMGPQYRPILREVLGEEGNTEGLHQLIEACIGYLANPNHIHAILIQDQAYLGLRHKEAQQRLGSSKGGPNRGYELGSKKVMERLKAAFDGHDPWSASLKKSPDFAQKAFRELQKWTKKAGLEQKDWIPDLKQGYGDVLGESKGYSEQSQLILSEHPGMAFALTYCLDEPKVAYKPIVRALIEIGDKANSVDQAVIALKKAQPMTQKTLNRFFGINATSKTPRGLEAFQYALQVCLIAIKIRENKENP